MTGRGHFHYYGKESTIPFLEERVVSEEALVDFLSICFCIWYTC